MLRGGTPEEVALLESFAFQELQALRVGSCLLLVKREELKFGLDAMVGGRTGASGGAEADRGRAGEGQPSVQGRGVEGAGATATPRGD